MKNILKTKRNIILLILGLSILVLSVFGITYSFMTLIGSDSIGETNVGTGTSSEKDTLVFTPGDPFELSPGVHNLNSEEGNLTTSSTSSISLTPIKDSSLAKYYVYFIIDENDYEYTTYDSKPELILTVLDYNGNEITEIAGLDYVTSGLVTGFDVTTATGEFVVGEYSLLAENGNTVSHEWTFKLTMINLDSNQNANYDKVFKGGAYLNQSIEKANQIFTYTGVVQTFTPMIDGYYKVETWGAQGGNANSTIYGGYGAYTSGTIYLTVDDKFNIYVGGVGKTNKSLVNTRDPLSAGYNGGGLAGYNTDSVGHGGGGGSTDIRLNSNLESRIMVAGAGGGAHGWGGVPMSGGAAGALIGYNGVQNGTNYYINAQGGSQIYYENKAIGTAGGGGNTSGTFGLGGNSGSYHGGAGGAGYYGGGGSTWNSSVVGSGAGGSSFISGHTGSVAIISESNRTPKNTEELLVDFPIRYIEIGNNGSNVNAGNHIAELQAIDLNGDNVALNKPILEGNLHSTYRIERITDGVTDSAIYADAHRATTVDLEQGYNLSEIKLWRYYADGRTYNETYVKVYNEDKTKSVYLHNYETDGTYPETAEGKTMYTVESCETGTTNNSCSIHYSNKYFTDTVMIDGAGYNWTNIIGEQVAMPNPLGGYYPLGQGHTGNGHAKITFLGS